MACIDNRCPLLLRNRKSHFIISRLWSYPGISADHIPFVEMAAKPERFRAFFLAPSVVLFDTPIDGFARANIECAVADSTDGKYFNRTFVFFRRANVCLPGLDDLDSRHYYFLDHGC